MRTLSKLSDVGIHSQAAPPSTAEVKPLLASDSLAPDAKPAPTTGPTSVAEQLDAMKGSGPTLQTSSPAETPLDLFKGKELESAPAATTKSNGSETEKASGFGAGQNEPQNLIDKTVPGTEIAPDRPGDSYSARSKVLNPCKYHISNVCANYQFQQRIEVQSSELAG